MTKVTDFISRANGRTLFSLEVIPPVKGQNINNLLESIEPLMDFKPPFVDVTYHREELIDVVGPTGVVQRVPVRRRPGTVGICSRIMERFKVDAVPHVICGGFTKEETEDLLFDLHYLGIDNVLALRGDPEKSSNVFTPKLGGHRYASELIEQITELNKGILLQKETEAFPTDFCIGAAAYPEKHFEALSADQDFEYLKEKIRLGADYIVTQMFFDNEKYFSFVEKCRTAGITVQIIPGLKPLSTRKQLTILPKIFHLEFPAELTEAARKCETDRDMYQLGIEWGIHQARELKEKGAPILHFYTMGRSENVRRIAEAVF